MADPSQQSNSKRVKMALVPLLGLVLAYVIFGSSDDKKDAPATAVATPIATTAAVEAPAAPHREVAPRSWPNRTLSEIIAHDPFRLQQEVPTISSNASTSDDEEAEEQADAFTQLVDRFSTTVPDLVLHSRHGASAVIDGNTIREGDVLDGRARVVSIRPDGIILELLDTQ
jgi:hypothetical protein